MIDVKRFEYTYKLMAGSPLKNAAFNYLGQEQMFDSKEVQFFKSYRIP